MNIILFGPNGSGKGTQGSLLTRLLGLQHIEPGSIFRQHIKTGTPLGREAQLYIERGDLVPDATTIPMVLEAMRAVKDGWLLDGFPRSIVQASRLWEALNDDGISLDAIVEIQLARPIARERILGRRLCNQDPSHPNNLKVPGLEPVEGRCRICGSDLSARAEDLDAHVIDKRHDTYYDTEHGTLSAAKFFHGLADDAGINYVQLDGLGDIKDVQQTLMKALNLQPQSAQS